MWGAFYPLLFAVLILTSVLVPPVSGAPSLRLRPATTATKSGSDLHEDKPSNLRQAANDVEGQAANDKSDKNSEYHYNAEVMEGAPNEEHNEIAHAISDYLTTLYGMAVVDDKRRVILAERLAEYLLGLETSKPLAHHLHDIETMATAALSSSTADRRLVDIDDADEGTHEFSFLQAVFDGHDDLVSAIHDKFGIGEDEEHFEDMEYLPAEVIYGIGGHENIKQWVRDMSRELEYDEELEEMRLRSNEDRRRLMAENIADFLVDVAPHANGPVEAYLMDLERAAWDDSETSRPTGDGPIPFLRLVFAEYSDLTSRVDLAFQMRSAEPPTYEVDNRRFKSSTSAHESQLDDDITRLLHQYFIKEASDDRRRLSTEAEHDGRRRQVAESISDWLVSITPNATMSPKDYLARMDLVVSEDLTSKINTTAYRKRRLRSDESSATTATPFISEIFSCHEDLLYRAESSFHRRAEETKQGYHDAMLDSGRFEQVGWTSNGEPQYRFVPTNETKAEEARVLDEAHAAFNDLRSGMDRFREIQVESNAKIQRFRFRRLQTPRTGFDESFTLFEDPTWLQGAGIHRRRLSASVSDCVQDDDLCVASVGVLEDVNSGIDTILTDLSLVGQILGTSACSYGNCGCI